MGFMKVAVMSLKEKTTTLGFPIFKWHASTKHIL